MDVCTRCRMTITSLELLDTSIAQLQTLLAFLDEQLDWTEPTTQETYACKEIARSLYVLIRTLRAAGMKAGPASRVRNVNFETPCD